MLEPNSELGSHRLPSRRTRKPDAQPLPPYNHITRRNEVSKFEKVFDRYIAPFCIACGVVGFFIGIMMLGSK
jgi:hypothetical protein